MTKIIMPEDDVQALQLLSTLNDLLTRLQDKDVRKTLESGAASKFKEADAKVKEANATLVEANKVSDAAKIDLRTAEAAGFKNEEDKLKIDKLTLEFREMEEEFRQFSYGKLEDLLDREKLAEASIKDADKAQIKADAAIAKYEALSAELEGKLAKLKAMAA